MSIDNRMAAYAYYGITTEEDARAAGELESEGRMSDTTELLIKIEQLKNECDEQRAIALDCCDKRNIAVVEAEQEVLRLRAALEEIYKQANQINIIILARDALFGDAQPDTPGQRED